jgi:hypothetical protein
MKTKLLETHGWQGQTYGPGECEIPEGLANALGLKSAGSADLDDDETEADLDDDETEADLDDDKTLEGKADGVSDTGASTRSGKGKKSGGK